MEKVEVLEILKKIHYAKNWKESEGFWKILERLRLIDINRSKYFIRY